MSIFLKAIENRVSSILATQIFTYANLCLGMPICVLHAAATAGAVYGTVIVAFNWVSTYLAVCCLFAAT